MPDPRIARSADAPEVVRLVIKLLSELRGESWIGDEQSLVEKTRNFIRNGDCVAFLYNVDGRNIGVLTISVTKAVRTEGEYGIIQELYIEPEYRSTGYGRQLLEQAIAWMKEKGWPRLEVGLPSLPQWEKTLLFYEKNGFVQTGPRLKRLNV
jgi:GNAT superfamily N-acetyltransferase